MTTKESEGLGDRSFTVLEILNIASRDYPDDYLRHYYDQKTGRFNAAGSGDTLAEFIVREIQETFDATVPRRDQLAEVSRVLHRGITHLQGVIKAVTEAVDATIARTADAQEPLETSEQLPGPGTTSTPPRSTDIINIPPQIWETIIPVLIISGSRRRRIWRVGRN